MVDEMAAVRAATDRPFGVDLLTAMPGGMVAQVERIIEGGASVFVAGLGVPAEVVDLCHAHGLLVVNMCGKVDHARRALDAGCDMVVAQGTEAGGHTGQVATMPLVPADRRRGRRRHPGGGGRRHRRRPRTGRRTGARRRRGVDGHPLHRHPRGPRRDRLQGRAPAVQGGRHHHQPGVLRQDDAGAPQRVHPVLRGPPGELQPFPGQLGRSMQDGAWHLGGGRRHPGGRPRPARAIRPGRGWAPSRPSSRPADLVRRIVAEAEQVLAGLSRLAGR